MTPDFAPLSFFGGLPYASRPEGQLLLDVLAPEPAATLRPVVIYLHGGGWHEGDRGAALHPWLNPLLAARGFVTVSPTYRLSGIATWPAQLDDVRDAVAWVRKNVTRFGGDPERIGIQGFSAGAHLAALIAVDPAQGIRAAALAACPADLRPLPVRADDEVGRLLGGLPTPERLAEISPVCHVTSAAPPTMIVHGTRDEVVPFSQGEALRDTLRSAGVEVQWHAVDGGAHDWADTPWNGLDETSSGFGPLSADFFQRRL
ncbi:alpha/beta hydrolase fold domain-containing protein [Herbiconiux liangxiaofengii]|uniref:alpha/beta hydrolase fold domain-containing protein n=1 Tax=Herbiconiux liangxiaofengii TaxID=3342795 RepID=UPI0035B6BE11